MLSDGHRGSIAAYTSPPVPPARCGRLHRSRGDCDGCSPRAWPRRAARLHERGAFVAVNVRDASRAAEVARSIGPRALGVAADVAADEGPASVVKQTLDQLGRIDILINNAALPLTTRFRTNLRRRVAAGDRSEPHRAVSIDQAVLPAMKAQQCGRIVNISSTAGRMVSTRSGAHCTTSKTGLLGALTRAAAKELAEMRHHRERGLSRHDRHRTHSGERPSRRARPARRLSGPAAARHSKSPI